MGRAVPLREDFDAIQLRDLAKASNDADQTRRLLALAAVYDGMSRAEAAKVGGMDRQTLRDWAHRFNEAGPEGLTNRLGAGRPRRLGSAGTAGPIPACRPRRPPSPARAGTGRASSA